MPALKSVTALLLVNTGSRYEQKNEFGAAHLLEHLVFRGTKNYPNGQDLSIALDSIGASSNAFTAKEYTGFYTTAASSHLSFCLKVLKELVFYPLIRPQDVEQEKKVVVEEIKMHLDSPADFISDEFEKLVYSGTGLAHPISGSIASVEAQSASKLRSFLNRWYGLENLTLVLAGDQQVLTDKGLRQEIEQLYALDDLSERGKGGDDELTRSRSNGHVKKRQQFLVNNPISDGKKVVRKKEAEQSHIILGWPALKRDDPQRYVLTAFANVMGGNRSSRLFYKIREQENLAYYIYSDVDQYHDGGILAVSAGLNGEQVEKGIELIQDEFKSVANGKKPITAEELKRAKDYISGRVLLSLESSRAVAQHYGLCQVLLDREESPDDVIKGINKVSLQDVELLVKKIIKPDDVRLAMVKKK